MKKIYFFLLIFAALLPWAAKAQTLSDYTFSTGTDASKWVTLTPSATQLLTYTAYVDSKASAVTDIGFPFPFGENVYTQFSVNTDGNLKLGSSVTGTSAYSTPFSASNSNSNNPKINAFGCDGALNVSDHYVKSELIGNNLLVVEFSVGTYNTDTRSELYKWQIHLYSNGDIEIVYPDTNNLPETNPAVAHQCGFCLNSTDGWIITSTNNTATHFTAGTTTTNAIGTWFDANRYYRFEYPVLSCPKPSNLEASLTPGNGSIATLTWTPNPNGSENAWVLEYDTTANFYGASSVNVNGTPSANLTGLTAETTYYARVKAVCGENDESDWSNVIEFTPTDAYLLTVNDNTSTSYYVPFYYSTASSSYANMASQFIIPAADLADIQWASIEKLTFYNNLSSNSYGAVFTVYVGEVPITTQDSYTDWSLLTPVYTGNVSVVDNKMEIIFDTPFPYSTGNLLIGFKLTSPGSSGNTCYWYGVSAPSESAIYNLTTGSITKSSFLPKLTFEYTPGEAPACFPISELDIPSITHEGATVSWTSDESAWQIVWSTDENFDPNSVTPTAVNTNSYTITGLNVLTDYYVRVRSNCSVSDNGYSAWSNKRHFKTTSVATPVGDAWSEDFEGATCEWNLINTNQTNQWVWGTAASNGTGTHALYVSNNGGTSNEYTNNSTSIVYATKLLGFTEDKYLFAYDWMAKADLNYDYIRVWLAPTDFEFTPGKLPNGATSGFSSYTNTTPTGWISLDDGKLNDINEWYSKNKAVNVPAGNWYLVFMWCNDGSSGLNPPAAIDNVSITRMTCPYDVYNLRVDSTVAVTQSSATVKWSAGEAEQWQVAYSSHNNFPAEETTIAIVSDTTYNLTGLTAGIYYYVKVRVYCGETDYGAWCDAISFNTVCPQYTTIPFEENFDNMKGVTSGSTNYLPLCWNYYNACSYSTYRGYPVVYKYTNNSNSGDNFLRFYSYYTSSTTNYDPQDQYAILPAMPNISELRMRLYARAYSSGSSYDATFHVGVMSDPTDVSTFTEVATYTPTETTYELYTIPFNTYTGNGTYIAIKMNAAQRDLSTSSTHAVFIDDIIVEEIPSCLEPTNMAEVQNTATAHSVQFGWTATNNETTWKVQYRKVGETEWTTVAAPVTTNPYTLSGLDASSVYEVRVAAWCDPQNAEAVSLYCTPISIYTGCDVVTVFPWSENFEQWNANTNTSFNAPYAANLPCWINEHISETGSYIFQITSYLIGGNSTHKLQLPDQNPGTKAMLRLPEMNLPNNNYQFVLDVYRSNYGTLKPNEGVWVYASNDGNIEGASKLAFIPRQYTVGNDTIPAEHEIGWYTYELPIGISGTCYIILLGVNEWGAATYMDNFIVEPVPSCQKPNSLVVLDNSVRAHEATITWTEKGDATQWIVEFSTDANFTDVLYETVEGEPTYAFHELAASTTYYVRVKSHCGAGDESKYSNVVNFTTSIACPLPSNLTCIAYTATTVTLSWTDLGDATSWVVAYKTANDADFTEVVANTNPFTLENLTPDIEYTIKMKGWCNEAWTGWCDVINFEPTDKVIIGTAENTSSYLPTSCGYNYSYTQQIYTVEELGNAGLIESIDFYMTSATATTRNIDIYMVHTDKNSFTNNSDWITVTDADKVFSGNVNFAANAWNTITLDAGFVYSGMRNVAIIVDDNTGTYSSRNFSMFSTNDPQSHYYYSDNKDIVPNEVGAAGTVSNTKNYIRIMKGEIDPCMAPRNVQVVATTPHGFTATFNPVIEEQDVWSYIWTTTDTTPSETVDYGITLDTSFTIGGNVLLAPENTYYLWVGYMCDAEGEPHINWCRVPAQFTTPASCPVPTDLAVTFITDNLATISWDAHGGNAWQICLNGDETNLINVTENPYTLSGLTAYTSYTVKVRTDCNEEWSEWSTVDTFRTTVAVTLVGDYWGDDFEGESCDWEFINDTLTNRWTWGTAASNGEGTHALYISNDGALTNAYTFNQTSKVYVAKPLGFVDAKYKFSFDWRAKGEPCCDYLRVALVPATTELTAENLYTGFFYPEQVMGWILLDNGKLSDVNEWHSKELAIDVPAGNYYLVMFWNNDHTVGYNPPAAVDNVSIIRMSCLHEVVNLLVSSTPDVTQTTATVAWAAGEAEQWQVAYSSHSNFPAAETTIATVSEASCNLTGLTAGTKYYVKVRAYCGGEDYGTWCNAISFNTVCPQYVAIPFEENFDGLTDASSGSGNVLPLCWNYINTCSHTTYKNYPLVNKTTSFSHSGDNYLKFYSYYYVNTSSQTNYDPQDQYAILPAMQNISGLRMKLYARAYDNYSNYDATFHVGVMSDPTDASTFTEIATYNPTSKDYQQYVIPFNTYNGTGTYIAIKIDAVEIPSTGGANRAVCIDDIRVEELPSCIEPINLAEVENSATANSVTFGWTASNNETTWKVQYREDGETDWNTVAAPVTTNPYTLTGLDTLSGYNVRVAAWCNPSNPEDISEYSFPLTVYTSMCTPQDRCEVNYKLEDGYGDGWNDASIDIVDVETQTIIHHLNMATGSSLEGTFYLCSGRTIQFVWNSGRYDNECTYSFTNIESDTILSGSGALTTTYYTMNCPTCFKPTDFAVSNVTSTSATFSWTGSGESYQIRYKELGEEQWDTTLNVGGSNNATIQNLENGIRYEAQIRTNCGNEEYSVWTSSLNFNTICPLPTGFQITEITMNSVKVTWDNGAYPDGDYDRFFLGVMPAGTPEADYVDYVASVGSEYNLRNGDPSWAQIHMSIEPNTDYVVYIRRECGEMSNYDNVNSEYITLPFTTLEVCPAPTDFTLTAGSITDTGATFTWNGTSDEYFVAYRTPSYYDGLTEDFSETPIGWQRYSGALNADGTAELINETGWQVGNMNGIFDSHAFVNMYSRNKYWLVVPSMTIGDNYTFRFDVAYTAYSGNAISPGTSGTDDRFVVLISTDNMATWSILRQWDNAGSAYVLNNIPVSGITVNNISLDSYVGQTVNIAFYVESTVANTDNNLHLDNLRIGAQRAAGEYHYKFVHNGATTVTLTDCAPVTTYEAWVVSVCENNGYSDDSNPVIFTTKASCGTPTDIVVEEVYSNGCMISFTPGSTDQDNWYYTYTTSPTQTPSYGVGNFRSYQHVRVVHDNVTEPDADRYLWIAYDCYDGTKKWSEPVLIHTLSCTQNIPYSYGFENRITWDCWTSSTDYAFHFSNLTAAGSHEGMRRLEIYGVGDNTLVMPEFTQEISDLKLTFWVRPYSNDVSGCGTFLVGYLTDPTDEGTFVAVGTYNYNDWPDNNYEEKIVSFPNAPAGARIAFRCSGGENTYMHAWYLDDIVVESAVSCTAPTNVTVSGITSSGATFSCDDIGAYKYSFFLLKGYETIGVWDELSTNQLVCPVILEPNTTYMLQARAKCSGGYYSDWSDPVEFTTQEAITCQGITVPYEQGFESGSAAVDCWTFLPDVSSATTPQVVASYANSGNNSLYMKGRGIYALPEITNVDNVRGLAMAFYVRQRAFAHRIAVGVMTDPTDANSFVEIARFNTGNNTSTSVQFSVDFSSYTGSGKYIAFRNVTTNTDASSQNWIDDINISEIPAVACQGITVPYEEGFEDPTTLTDGSPNCWTFLPDVASATVPKVSSSYTNSGSNSLYMNGRGIYSLPEITNAETVSGLTMTFYVRQRAFAHRIAVGVMTDPTDANSFVEVARFNTGNNTSTSVQFSVDFSSYTGSGKYIAFRNVTTNSDAVSQNWIDDINITDEPIISCQGITVPYEQGFEDVTTLSDGSLVCWTFFPDVSSAAAPKVSSSYSNSGNNSIYMNGRGIYALPEITNIDNVSNLVMTFSVRQRKYAHRIAVGVMTDPTDPSTFTEVERFYNGGEYTNFVQHTVNFSSYTGNGKYIAFRNVATNSDAVSQNWIDDISIQEFCGITVPYEQNFDDLTSNTGSLTGVSPRCWNFIPDVATATIPQLSTSYANSGNYSLYMNGRGIYALPEIINVENVSNLTMSFYVRQRKYAHRIAVGVMTDPTDPSTFTEVVRFYNGGDYTNFVQHTVDFSTYTGDGKYIAFRNVATNSDAVSQNWIDDINISEIPAVTCQGITVPYEQGFESGSEVANCWTFLPDVSSATTPEVVTSYANSGNNSLYMKGRGIYALPEITNVDNVGGLAMTFYVRQRAFAHRIAVGVMTDPTDATSFVEIARFNTGNNTSTSMQFSVDFSSYIGNGKYIAFRNVTTNTDAVSQNWIDDINISLNTEGIDSVGTEVAQNQSVNFEDTEFDSYGDNSEEPFNAPNAIGNFNAVQLSLYPNPTTGKVTLVADEVTMVEVYSQIGSKVATFTLNNERVIDLSNLPKGVYILRVTMPQGIAVRKVVKN